MRRAAAAALLALTVACNDARTPGPAAPRRGGPRPNVVLIVMDTTRADHCSVNGYERPTTPQLEALGREGVVFESAWSPAGWTGPAHAALFTGLRPENHGFHRANRHYLMPAQETLAETLRDAGYRTAAFTNNAVLCAENGLEQGFDTFVRLYLDEQRPYPWAAATHEQALEWVAAGAQADSQPDAPFFLFINHMEPHLTYEPPAEFARQFVEPGAAAGRVRRGRETDADRLFEHNSRLRLLPPHELRLLSDLYDAEVAYLDREIGRLIDGLRRGGLLENTVVVVTSDHGENLGEHGLVDHMFSLHRTIRHVPLVVRFPGVFDGGRRVADAVRLEDLHPTLLDLCGVAVPPGLDGRSLTSDVPGRLARGLVDAPYAVVSRRRRESRRPFDTAWLRRDHRAVFDGRYHLIRASDGSDELFDTLTDPAESVNLADQLPAVRARLALELAPF